MRLTAGLQLILAGLVALASARPALRANVHGARAPSTSKDVIVQMFEWDWDSIASECTNFLGPAGYGFVQGQCERAHPLKSETVRFTWILLQRARRKNTSQETNGGLTISLCPTSSPPSEATGRNTPT